MTNLINFYQKPFKRLFKLFIKTHTVVINNYNGLSILFRIFFLSLHKNRCKGNL